MLIVLNSKKYKGTGILTTLFFCEILDRVDRLKQIAKEMLRVYKPISNLDWMNYKITRKSDITVHHIIKKENQGKLEWGNIALLLPVSHNYLHLIECKDIDTYITLNKVFKMINNQMEEPNREQRELIEFLLQEFEEKHKWEKGSKGKILIQSKYLERGAF